MKIALNDAKRQGERASSADGRERSEWPVGWSACSGNEA